MPLTRKVLQIASLSLAAFDPWFPGHCTRQQRQPLVVGRLSAIWSMTLTSFHISEIGREMLGNTDESTLAGSPSSPRIVPSPIERPPAAWNGQSFRAPLPYSPQAAPQQVHSVPSPPITESSVHASPTPHTSKWKKWRKRLNPIAALKKVGVGLGL